MSCMQGHNNEPHNSYKCMQLSFILRTKNAPKINFSVTVPQAILFPHHESVMTTILSDMQDVLHILTSSQPPLLPHTPPTATRLLWLRGLEERTSGAVGVLRSAAPQLLEGELGWKLRQTYSELTERLNRLI